MKFLALLFATVVCAAAAPFEIKEGDRVLLLGDALLERENTYGLLEKHMHEQFRTVKFTVRNLSWSGETPHGWSRASFDGPEKGWERLKEQIAEVKPTVAILGFGMAASLQEMTDRSGDQTLNPDPVRYGAEPMSAPRFKKELGELMDAINERTSDKQPARFVLLAPIRHEDRSGLLGVPMASGPASETHNTLLANYTKAIEELAADRGTRFVPSVKYTHEGRNAEERSRSLPLTDNGIQLNLRGYQVFALTVKGTLEWNAHELAAAAANRTGDPNAFNRATGPDPLRAPILPAILKKNDLFFHQFRPANSTYLFGFRKHEQGKNAAEMPKFTPLIEAADAEIDRLKRLNPEEQKAAEQPSVVIPQPKTVVTTPDPKTLLRILPGPRYIFGALDTNDLAALKKGIATLSDDDRKGIRIEAEKSVVYADVKAVLSALGEANITNIVFSAVDPALPLPNFTVTDDLEITLWADTNLVGKPVGMNWDAQGRLWVACSPVYPQITPGGHPDDKVVVIEDTDHDGKADKSTNFATNFIIAAGVAPDFGSYARKNVADQREKPAAAKNNRPAADEAFAAGPADNPAQQTFVNAFLEVKKAEDLENANDLAGAIAKTESALAKLEQIKKEWPNWQPSLIEYRLKKNGDTLARLKANLAKREPAAASTPSITAAYVGASTELVRVEDTDGDGIGDTRRIIVSGLGTEDTHHTVHTLRWGPDGRLYFNQSIYIHSHMETPYGMVRLNSGGICSYDPRTERIEVFARGFINTWGHAWDKWGQSFATDGAGFEGVHWLIPGAMYRTYEGARRILPSISPGSYPKYSGLELIQSPLFPDDWQGNAITCDFRAHKITRFQINDLSQPTEPGKEPLSGYITKELPNPIVTSDASFRPIDVKHGPDGALYIADWTNPIINHGEVDFRDPRRDHTNGRIWRVAQKGKAALKWESLVGLEPSKLLALLLESKSHWTTTHATVELNRAYGSEDVTRHNQAVEAVDEDWMDRNWEETLNSVGVLNIYRVMSPHSGHNRIILGLAETKEPRVRAFAGRRMETIDLMASMARYKFNVAATLARDPNPRVRVEAMRGLAAAPGRFEDAISLVLEAALNVPGGAAKQIRSEDKGTNQFNQPTFADTADPYYGYAAWLSVNDLAPQVMEWIERESTAAKTKDGASGSAGAPPVVPGASPGTANVDKPTTRDNSTLATRDAKIAYALQCLRPEQSSALLSKIVQKRGIPKDGSGPWIELIGQAGGPAELRVLLDGLLANTIPDGEKPEPLADKERAFTNKEANRRAAAALVAAAKRGVKPANPPYGGWTFHLYAPDEALPDIIRLVGLWKLDYSNALAAHVEKGTAPEILDATFEAWRLLATDDAAKFLTAFLAPHLEKHVDDPFLRNALQDSDASIRRRALIALAGFRPDIAKAALRGVLNESGSDVKLWRELFTSDAFTKALLQKLPEIPKDQAAPALRAARELGKRGEKLVAALTPLAGEAPAAPVTYDIASLVDLTKKNGNPVEGELVYRRAALTCTVCHAIGGAGGKVAPDLGTIGASAPLDYIIESTVNPGAKVKEGFHAIAVTTKDGKTLSGTVAKESDTALTLRDMTGAEQTVEKSNVKERTNIGSLMPAGLTATLNPREQSNLFAFLSQLGKSGPFDASKASIARAWRVYPGDQVEAVVAGKADAAKGTPVYSLVDGRVTKELMEVPLAIAGDQPTIVAAARFALVNGGQHRLHLAGITKAWLDGQPLAIASDPNPVVDLPAGEHALAVKLDTKTLPAHFRAECPDGRFLTE